MINNMHHEKMIQHDNIWLTILDRKAHENIDRIA